VVVSDRLARGIVRLAARVVPAERRAEWLEEWLAELEALERERARMAGRAPNTPGVAFPGRIAFALGALPHALWTVKEGWTMGGMLQDVRYSARVLRRSPGFTVVAALTLALGIGANAAIFSLVNGLLLRAPEGVAEPDRLVQIARSYESAPRWDNFSWPAVELIEREARTLSGVAAYQVVPLVLGRGAEAEPLLGQSVSGGYFEVVGVRPLHGRLLQPADDLRPGAHPVVVLSHALWTRRFGADPAVVGRTVSLGASPYEVVGVAPEGFTGVETIGTPPALWVPVMQHPRYARASSLPTDQWGSSWLNTFGRMADGVSFEEVRTSMAVVSDRLRQASTINEDMQALVVQGVGLDPDDRQEAETVSFLLLLVVGIVLLLTCTNVANLFLARASTRRSEIGLRIALGAGRQRVARQLLTESLLLALVATALAAPVVLAAGRFIPLMVPYTLAVSVDADGRVFAFLAAVGLAAGVLFGTVPAWASTRRDVAATLREGGATGGRPRTRLRDGLVVVQLGLSLGLVSGAALLGRSVLNASAARPGFEPAGLVAAVVNLGPTGRYDETSGMEFFVRLRAGAEELPGVGSATVASQMPIAGGHSRSTVQPAGRDDVEFEAESTVVGDRYFETMGIPILEGRALGGVHEEAEPVVVVNDALARMFWPGESAVGKQLGGEPGWRVVGVAGDVQMRSLRSPANPGVYYPLQHAYESSMAVHVRAQPGSVPSAQALGQVVAAVDAEVPVTAVVDLHDALAASMGETRTIGFLVGSFALLALVLAAVGLYGLVSYGTSQRVREIGIRMALGARPNSLVRLVLAHGVGVSLLGVAAGVAVSYWLGRALEGFLFGVAPADPSTLGASSLVLLLAAGLAAWVPARRASRVDAVVSLRD
jgi:predicted permease